MNIYNIPFIGSKLKTYIFNTLVEPILQEELEKRNSTLLYEFKALKSQRDNLTSLSTSYFNQNSSLRAEIDALRSKLDNTTIEQDVDERDALRTLLLDLLNAPSIKKALAFKCNSALARRCTSLTSTLKSSHDVD